MPSLMCYDGKDELVRLSACCQLSTPKSPVLALSSDTGLSSSDRITSDSFLLVSGLLPGATWEYSSNNGKSWKTGVGSKFRIKPGSYGKGVVQVRQTSAAGETSAPFKRFNAFTIDTKVRPARIKLGFDTGSSQRDRVTSNGTVRVIKLEVGASWEYSLDSGSSWLKGTGATFVAPPGSYAKGQVLVRQLDVAGNLSAARPSFAAFTVDTEAIVPEPQLAFDSNVKGDRVTNVADIVVTGVEPGAILYYSVDSGKSWIKASGNRFAVPQDIYKRGQLQVRQTDLAGNVSLPFTTFAPFTIDRQPPAAPTLDFLEDSGVSQTDRITNVRALVVGGLEDDAYWQFSIDRGKTWTTDGGLGFTVPDGSYSKGDVRVRQVDLAGNRSTGNIGFAPFVVDTTSPVAPNLALGSTSGVVDVSLLEDGATWEFSVDSGSTWLEGSGTSFVVEPGTYGVGQVQARQSDVAGNQGPANTSFQGFSVGTPPSSQPLPQARISASALPVEGDVLIGTPNQETFSWANPAATPLARYDVILGYGSDDQLAIGGLTYGQTLSGSVGELQSLSENSVSNLLTAAKLPASGAAAFTVAGLNGTFVALNDQRSAFQSDSDGLVFLKGYTLDGGNTVTVI